VAPKAWRAEGGRKRRAHATPLLRKGKNERMKRGMKERRGRAPRCVGSGLTPSLSLRRRAPAFRTVPHALGEGE
jgi:hypothetical protein